MRKLSKVNIQDRLSKKPSHQKSMLDKEPIVSHKKVQHDNNFKKVLQDKINSQDISLLLKKGKKSLIICFTAYITLILCILVMAVQDIRYSSDGIKKEIYLNIKNDFFDITKNLKDLSKEVKSIKSDKKIAEQVALRFKTIFSDYPFIDVFYILDYFPNEGILNKKVKINKFEINPIKNISEVYNTYLNNIANEPRLILANQKITSPGIYYYDQLSPSAYYILPFKKSKYIFVRFDQELFSEHYTISSIKPYLNKTDIKDNGIVNYISSLNIEKGGDVKFPFEFIHNITDIKIQNENTFFFHSTIVITYFMIFFVTNFFAYLGYYALVNYYKNLQKISILEKKFELVNQNKSANENRMQHLIETANFVPWMADIEKNIFTYIGSQITDLTGIAYENWLSKGYFLSHIYQEDRDALFKAVKGLETQSHVSAEYRVYTNTGNILWLRNTISKTFFKESDSGKEKMMLQGFIIDITAQKKVLETLETAKLVAEKASQMKSNFLASMSHELRTPLNSIIGFADIIGSLSKDNKMVSEYSSNILMSGRHLLDLINDILDYSKIEAGEFEIRKEPTAITEIFDSCKILLQSRADELDIALIVKLPLQDYYLNIDPLRVKQVIINLLTNALKFNKPNGKVSLTCTISENKSIIIKVTDTGIGMKPEDLKIALEKFRQIDDKKNRQQEGTGLGLSISKSLIELHDGTLTLDSIYGKGTQVTIMLPPSTIHSQVENKSDYSSTGT